MNYFIKNFTVNSKFLNKSISIIIALPTNFDQKQAYETYLVFDGNDLLNHYTANILTNCAINNIFIGISCDNNIERFNNWATYHNQKVVTPMKIMYPSIAIKNNYLGGNGTNFINFISQELLPMLSSQQKILINNLNLLGCSMGAYFILQMIYLSNLTFKKVLLFSPPIWFNENIITDLKTKILNHDQPLIVNLWVGLKEPKIFEKSFAVDYYHDSLKTKTTLTKKNNVTVNFVVAENGGHGFKWWIAYLNQHNDWWIN